MITIWCPRKMTGAKLLVDKLIELGHTAERVIGGDPPEGAIRWGCGGGNKFKELATLAAAGVPVPAHSLTKQADWLARRFKHREANDLLAGLAHGDYYVEYVPTKWEHRIHVFNGRSIRVAMKIPRTDNPHPKFRSWQAGWRFGVNPEYTAKLPPKARDYAVQACKALGYDFGAVDIATTISGTAVVWEVNSGPGIEGSTVDCYARAVIEKFNR